MTEPFSVLLERQKYPGYGRCIYCLSDGGAARLRREHIIPRALGGNAEILQASCSDCEAKTSHVDGALANAMFRDLRIYLRLQSRRKTTTRTTHLPTTFLLPNGETRTELMLVEERPVEVHVPLLFPPGLVSGVNLDGVEIRTMHSIIHIPEKFRLPPSCQPSASLKIEGQFDVYTFSRALAKIAHCFTVITHGLDAFEPFLPPIILGENANPLRYIGGTYEPPPPPWPGGKHHIAMFEMRRDGNTYFGVDIRLFAPFGEGGMPNVGMPVYRVISGLVRQTRT